MRIVWLIVLLLVVGAGYYAYTRMERVPPVVGTLTSPAFAGSEYHHLFRFNDDGSGVRHVHIWLEAGGKTYELAEQEYPGNALTGAELSLEREIEVVVKSKELGLGDGQARLMAEATDYSWLANTTQVQIPLAIDTTPPRASLLTGLTYVRRGGSELAVYTVEEGVEKNGIRVGNAFFPGFVDPGDAKRRVAFFAIPTDAPEGAKPVLLATDRAGNEAKIALVTSLLERSFPADTITLTNDFMSAKVAELLTGFTGSPLDGYLKINRELRKENDAQVFELCKKSSVDRLWSGPFLQMPNSHAGAKFAERRSYVYQGKSVDQQTHMGYDFASTSHADVPAANDGVVVFAGPLGIYGNAVIVDHGLGLFSLYGHLSEIGVQNHSAVVKGEALGKTGTTGLAGGDHLHFAMLLDGVFVDPLEWFDKKWLEDHIEGKLSAKPPSGG
ncbi:MAG TPA: peptidoglycan DD-metalloendopeptidase family protein [Myxococcota bacterium]|nr:peptidoglycan DD-metalloendopeptidase family protein [Myxococcota bacterium]